VRSRDSISRRLGPIRRARSRRRALTPRVSGSETPRTRGSDFSRASRVIQLNWSRKRSTTKPAIASVETDERRFHLGPWRSRSPRHRRPTTIDPHLPAVSSLKDRFLSRASPEGRDVLFLLTRLCPCWLTVTRARRNNPAVMCPEGCQDRSAAERLYNPVKLCREIIEIARRRRAWSPSSRATGSSLLQDLFLAGTCREHSDASHPFVRT